LADEMRSTKPAPGFKRVIVPGDLEFESQSKIDQEGISLTPSVGEQLKELSAQQGVSFPTELA